MQRIGSKRTVQTGRRTERNPDVQTVTVLIVNFSEQFQLPLRDIDRQLCLLVGSPVCLFHIPTDFVPAFALLQKLHRNFRRPDSGQRPPRKLLPRISRQKPVQILFQTVFRVRPVGKIHRKRALRQDGAAALAPDNPDALRQICNPHLPEKRFPAGFLLRRHADRLPRIKCFDQRMNVILKLRFV